MSIQYEFLRHDQFDEDGFPVPHIHGPGDAAATVPRPAGGGNTTTTAPPPPPPAANDPWTYDDDVRWRDVGGRRIVQQYDPLTESWVTISTTASPTGTSGPTTSGMSQSLTFDKDGHAFQWDDRAGKWVAAPQFDQAPTPAKPKTQFETFTEALTALRGQGAGGAADAAAGSAVPNPPATGMSSVGAANVPGQLVRTLGGATADLLLPRTLSAATLGFDPVAIIRSAGEEPSGDPRQDAEQALSIMARREAFQEDFPQATRPEIQAMAFRGPKYNPALAQARAEAAWKKASGVENKQYRMNALGEMEEWYDPEDYGFAEGGTIVAAPPFLYPYEERRQNWSTVTNPGPRAPAAPGVDAWGMRAGSDPWGRNVPVAAVGSDASVVPSQITPETALLQALRAFIDSAGINRLGGRPMAGGGQMVVGPSHIVDDQTGAPLASLGEAGPEALTVTPLSQGGGQVPQMPGVQAPQTGQMDQKMQDFLVLRMMVSNAMAMLPRSRRVSRNALA